MARRKNSASKTKKNSPKKTYRIDLRKFKKKLRKIGLSKVWADRVISAIKSYRKIDKWFAGFHKKNTSLSLKKLQGKFNSLFVKKRKRGRPAKKKKKALFRKIRFYAFYIKAKIFYIKNIRKAFSFNLKKKSDKFKKSKIFSETKK